MSQALLDEVGHQHLRSLLVLHQHIVRGSDLVSIEAVQQCNTDHSRWREKNEKNFQYKLVVGQMLTNIKVLPVRMCFKAINELHRTQC